MRRLERRVMWGIVFGVAVYLVLAVSFGASDVWGSASRVGAWVMASALGLSLVNYAVRFAKWQYYLRVLGVEGVSASSSLNVFLAGFVMSITPGKVGEVLKSALLKEEHGVEVSRTAPIVLAERLTDLLGLCVVASLGISIFAYGRWVVGAGLVMVVVALGLIGSERLVMAGIARLGRWERVSGLAETLERAYASTRELLAWRPLVAGTLMSAASWSMEGIAFHLIVDALGGGVGALGAMFLFSVTTIAGALSFLPGGLGVTEGGMIGGLMWMGFAGDEASASAAAYLIRLATLWFGVGLGVVSLGVFRWRMRSGARRAQPEE